MVVAKGGAAHEGLLLERGRFHNALEAKESLCQRFKEQIKHVCAIIASWVRTAGYVAMALLGSIILVLADVSHILAPCASYATAKLARPGYNSAWEWTSREVGVRIQGVSVYVLLAYCLCVLAYQTYVVLMNLRVLFRYCLLKATSQARSSRALRADLVKLALISHFRRIFLLFLFHTITVLIVYPLVVVGVPCLTGIMIAQLFGNTELFNRLLRRRYRVIMRLSDSEVSASTVDRKELTRRFIEAGLPGI